MQRHFDQDLAHLKQQLLRMGGLVESQIQQALQALVDRDSDLAVDVIIASLLGIAAMTGLLPLARPDPAMMDRPADANKADPAAVPGKPAGSSRAPQPDVGAGQRVRNRDGRPGSA